MFTKLIKHKREVCVTRWTTVILDQKKKRSFQRFIYNSTKPGWTMVSFSSVVIWVEGRPSSLSLSSVVWGHYRSFLNVWVVESESVLEYCISTFGNTFTLLEKLSTSFSTCLVQDWSHFSVLQVKYLILTLQEEVLSSNPGPGPEQSRPQPQTQSQVLFTPVLHDGLLQGSMFRVSPTKFVSFCPE